MYKFPFLDLCWHHFLCSAYLLMLFEIFKIVQLLWKIMEKVSCRLLFLDERPFQFYSETFYLSTMSSGLSMAAYRENKKLSDFLDVLSLSIDKSGVCIPCFKILTFLYVSITYLLCCRESLRFYSWVEAVSNNGHTVASREECVWVEPDCPHSTLSRGGESWILFRLE